MWNNLMSILARPKALQIIIKSFISRIPSTILYTFILKVNLRNNRGPLGAAASRRKTLLVRAIFPRGLSHLLEGGSFFIRQQVNWLI
jgi:uncharacterized membrane protein YdjX (TVP38/TMEM64 family)